MDTPLGTVKSWVRRGLAKLKGCLAAMSEAPDLTETEAFAAEHALGVLTAAERRAGRGADGRRPGLRRPGGGLARAAGADGRRRGRRSPPPPPLSGPRIERALPANDNAASARACASGAAPRPALAALAAASIAAAVMLANRPPVVIQPPPPGQLLERQPGQPVGRADAAVRRRLRSRAQGADRHLAGRSRASDPAPRPRAVGDPRRRQAAAAGLHRARQDQGHADAAKPAAVAGARARRSRSRSSRPAARRRSTRPPGRSPRSASSRRSRSDRAASLAS